MRNSAFQLTLAIMLLILAIIDLAISDIFQPIWIVGLFIVLAIMGLTMEVERKG